jgi:chromate transporter
MLKKIKKTVFNVAVMLITFCAMILFSLLSVSFSSIFYILIFGAAGLLIYTVGNLRNKIGEDKK